MLCRGRLLLGAQGADVEIRATARPPTMPDSQGLGRRRSWARSTLIKQRPGVLSPPERASGEDLHAQVLTWPNVELRLELRETLFQRC